MGHVPGVYMLSLGGCLCNVYLRVCAVYICEVCVVGLGRCIPVCVCVLPARENLFFFLNNAASCSSVYSMEPRKWDHGVIGLWILNVGRVVDCLGCLIHSFIHSFIHLWLHWVFIAVRGLSLVAASGGYSSLQCMGFSLQWLLLLWSTGSRAQAQ